MALLRQYRFENFLNLFPSSSYLFRRKNLKVTIEETIENIYLCYLAFNIFRINQSIIDEVQLLYLLQILRHHMKLCRFY